MKDDRKIQAVIFDMDGLLLDSEGLWIDCWTEVGSEAGLPVEDIRSAARAVIGMNAQATRETFLRVLHAEMDYDYYKAKASERFAQAEKEGRLLLKEGAEEILSQLHARGYRLALATSTEYRTAERQMRERGLWQYFHACAFGSEVAHSKPAPDVFLLAAERLGVAPEQSCVLEDSYNGVRAAHAAGMRCIMVPDLLPPDEEMRQLADSVVPDLEHALPEILNMQTARVV